MTRDPCGPFRMIDPATRTPLVRACSQTLTALQESIAKGHAQRRNGKPIPTRVEGAYVSEDGRIAYLDVDAIPSFIAEEAIELATPLPTPD